MNNAFPLALVMIQPDAMPGSYLNNGASLDDIEKAVLDEADMIVRTGFDGFILQNMHDGPASQTARPETIAFMTRLGRELKQRYPDKILGILVNWDGVASVAVAEATGADFVRVEYLFTGVSVSSVGLMSGQCEQICDIRKRLGSRIPVYADVQEIGAMYLCPKPKDQAAVDIVKSAFADGLFASGKTTEESLELIGKIRARLPDVPVFLGGGATGDNIFELMKHYDGVSVATWIKNGDMRNPIDPERAELFLAEIKRARVARRESEGKK